MFPLKLLFFSFGMWVVTITGKQYFPMVNETMNFYINSYQLHSRTRRHYGQPYFEDDTGIFLTKIETIDPTEFYHVLLDTSSHYTWIQPKANELQTVELGADSEQCVEIPFQQFKLQGYNRIQNFYLLGLHWLTYNHLLVKHISGPRSFYFSIHGALGIGPTPSGQPSFWSQMTEEFRFLLYLLVSLEKKELTLVGKRKFPKSEWKAFPIVSTNSWIINVQWIKIGTKILCFSPCSLLIDLALTGSYAPKAVLPTLVKEWNAQYVQETNELHLDCSNLAVLPTLMISFDDRFQKAWETKNHYMKLQNGRCLSCLSVHTGAHWILGINHLKLLTLAFNGHDNEVLIKYVLLNVLSFWFVCCEA